MRALLLLLAAATAHAASTAPQLRLGDAARPTRYTVELTVDPSQEELRGVIDIDIVVARAIDVLWLNGNDLTIQKAGLGSPPKDGVGRDGSPSTPAKVLAGQKDFVGFALGKPLQPGPARVHIEYTARLSSKDSTGASRQKEGGDWYVFTHFEPIDARRVFPCFDEPAFKTPWQLSLRVRGGDRAFANTPQTGETVEKGGWRRVEFAPSKPLPSYLVAFAVGPIEVVEAGKSARSGTPVRILVPRGLKERARWAAEVTHQSLEHLEDYFGTPYPYEKLDCIAVPLFSGAMENPGLITFNSSLILQKPAEETIDRRRAYAQVATHELAHQWFGDLVTTAWWDDIWLNEAFATWMTPKIIETWQPAWGAPEDRINIRSNAMGADSLVSARKIRQPIATNDDIKNAFDGITYQKGATVIGMFERFVGPDRFRRGVQRYMKEHAYGNATAVEFLAAISAEAGRDVAPAFSTFLDQPGVPMVTFDLQCGKSPHLHLAQQRYLPLGSTGGGEQQVWQIPVCVRFPGGRACTLLAAREGDLALPGCPAWVEPNDGGANYYRAQLQGDLHDRLEKAGLSSLTVPEKLSLISDRSALVRAGKLPLSSLLELAPRLSSEPSRFVQQSLAGAVGWLRDSELVSPARRPAYARYLRDLFGARAQKLGWSARPGDDEDARILRSRLVPLVADAGEDPPLIAEAQKLAATWLADHKAVDPDMTDGFLSIAAQHGDRALYDRWLTAARAEADRAERRRLLGALASFRDPALVAQSLAVLLTDAFEVRESITLLWGAGRDPATRRLAWGWLQANYDPLVARFPRDGGVRLPFLPAGLCDEAAVPQVRAFFIDRVKKFEGGPRQLDQALEQLHLCAAYRTAHAASVETFLARRRQ